MRGFRKIARAIALAAFVSLVGCGKTDKPAAPQRTGEELTGYAGLKFGISLDQALAATDASLFGAARLKECRISLPVRGCLLLPAGNLATFQTHDGVPYTLTLAFNRFDKLTDIELKFVRRTMDSPEERLSRDECRSIHERTIDWVVRDFGDFDGGKPQGNMEARTTPGGNSYLIPKQDENFVATAMHRLPKDRDISIISSYILVGGDPSCEVGVDFSDTASIERWQLSHDEQAQFDSFAK